MKRTFFFLFVLLLAWGAYESIDGWRTAHPSIEWVPGESETFSVMIPSRWKVRPSDSSSGDSSTSVGDRSAWDLQIEDQTPLARSLDDIVGEIRGGQKDASAEERVVLENGVEARTWTDYFSMVETAVKVRRYAFQAPNGRIYYAQHWVPPNWKGAWFYNRTYRRILGSMKFKDAAPPKKG